MPLQTSWVDGANEGDGFGLNHLPFGAFVHRDKNRAPHDEPHLCVRVGEMLLDLHACAGDGLFESLSGELQGALRQPTLHRFLALGRAEWQSLRQRLIEILAADVSGAIKTRVDWFLHFVEHCDISLPIVPRGYTDFYASPHHARRVGELFRPDNPLLPNYRHVPIAYNGRASSLVASGTAIRRPHGQLREGVFGPSAALDYELELAYVLGPGNAPGAPIPIAYAYDHLFGVSLLNDWSARDIQAWEYQPLGPFLGKSFATSMSPWITPMAALEPFLVPPTESHESLPYLQDLAPRHPNLALTVALSTEASRAAGLAPFVLSQSNPADLYWTAAQMVAHHASNGCKLEPGDVLATGTISGAARSRAGCLLELTRNGTAPHILPNGESRAWLLDGDEITLTASASHPDHGRIMLGECTGRIVPAIS